MTAAVANLATQVQALRDILSGPRHMWQNLATAMPAARELAAEFAETVVHRDDNTKLRARKGRVVFKQSRRHEYDNPTGMRLRLFTLRTLVSHWIHRPDPANLTQPEVEFGKLDAHWWRLPVYDSALVSSADGRGKNIYTRDRGQYRRKLRDSLHLHRRLRRRWSNLAEQYRRHLPELTSPEAWRAVFEKKL